MSSVGTDVKGRKSATGTFDDCCLRLVFSWLRTKDIHTLTRESFYLILQQDQLASGWTRRGKLIVWTAKSPRMPSRKRQCLFGDNNWRMTRVNGYSSVGSRELCPGPRISKDLITLHKGGDPSTKQDGNPILPRTGRKITQELSETSEILALHYKKRLYCICPFSDIPFHLFMLVSSLSARPLLSRSIDQDRCILRHPLAQYKPHSRHVGRACMGRE
jgi:hypothetical protein